MKSIMKKEAWNWILVNSEGSHDVYCRAFVENIDEFLYRRNAIDAALLFETESELDQGCHCEVLIELNRITAIKQRVEISSTICISLTLRACTTSLATTTCASWCSACRRRTPIPGWRTSGRFRQRSSPSDPQGSVHHLIWERSFLSKLRGIAIILLSVKTLDRIRTPG